jgi:uncharacterized membrane protein YhhN
MLKSYLVSAFLYFFLGIFFILSTYFTGSLLQMFLKSLIIPSLILFFFLKRGKQHCNEDKFIIAALIFSWIGDVLLQIKNGGDLLFMLGLIAFLLTHVFYTIVFFGTEGEFIFLKTKRLLILVIILYGSLAIYTILPGLGSMQIPVMVYGIVITGMVLAALSRFGKVNVASYLLVFLGAFLFLISDSLIAFNKFKQAFPFAEIFIMGSYLAGQFMIIRGILMQYENRKSN